MKTNPKSIRVTHLVRLLDTPANDNDELRYLRALGKSGKPSAAPVLAGYLHIRGPVGHRAALSLVRLGESSSFCFGIVLRIVRKRLQTSLDSDEIRNALRVYEALVGRYTPRNAA